MSEAVNPNQINISVISNYRDLENDEVTFKIKKTTQLGKLMDRYCKRINVQKGVRFIYEGERVNETDTPQSLGMNTDCVLQCSIDQIGG